MNGLNEMKAAATEKKSERTNRYVEGMPKIADDGFVVQASADFAQKEERQNPISDLIDDELYEILVAKGLLYEKGVRDHNIRMAYRQMRQQQMAAAAAIEELRAAHPYLQYDTVRKIVYARNR